LQWLVRHHFYLHYRAPPALHHYAGPDVLFCGSAHATCAYRPPADWFFATGFSTAHSTCQFCKTPLLGSASLCVGLRLRVRAAAPRLKWMAVGWLVMVAIPPQL